MNRIIKWLKTRLSRREVLVVTDPPNSSESINADELDLPKNMQDLVSDAPMPDIYADEHDVPAPDRKFLDPSSPDADKTTGFNPYDTAKMHKK